MCSCKRTKINWTLSKKKDQLSCLHRVPSDVARDKLLHIKTLARLHTLDSQSRLTCAQHNLSSRTFSDLKNYCWKPQRHEASPSPCTSNMFSWRSAAECDTSCEPIGQNRSAMWRHSVSRLHAQQPHRDNTKLVFLSYESFFQHACPLRSRSHERQQKDSRGESVGTQKAPFLFQPAFSVTASLTWLLLQAKQESELLFYHRANEGTSTTSSCE